MNLNEKDLKYGVWKLVKHYNFGVGCTSIQDCSKNLKKMNLKIWEFKTNTWHNKKLKIKNISIANM
jgi:hypothetical protein